MGKTSRCHIKIRYLLGKNIKWEKPLMSYKNTIYGENIGKNLKIIYMGKTMDVI